MVFCVTLTKKQLVEAASLVMETFSSPHKTIDDVRTEKPIRRLPASVYHLTDAPNWTLIQKYGLLSTRRLLELVEMDREERSAILCKQRTQQLILENGAMISDQKPMASSALAKCLVGITPEQWYELLNGKVFFWFDRERLNRMRRVMLHTPKVVLVIDTERLLTQYADKVTLTAINTGNARRAAARRARATFVPYTQWLAYGWQSEAQALGTPIRPSAHPPVELTIDDAVPDVMDFVLDVILLDSGELLSA